MTPRRLFQLLNLLFAAVSSPAWATSPSIVNTATTNVTTSAADAVVNLPGSIVAGNTLLVLLRSGGGGTNTWPAGWTELFDDTSDASNDVITAAWRKADGTEGATITVTNATAGKDAAIAWQISGAADPTVTAPEFSTLATGTSANPDPGSITPTGGSADYLFLATGGWEGIQTSPPGTFPTNYSLNQVGADTGTGGTATSNCRVAGAGRQLTASTEDPGTYTISASDDWTAITFAISPAPPGGGTTSTGWIGGGWN